MIELLTADTPNGKKISIMLEEIKFDYKITKINILKDDQFKPEFKKLSPFSKIPVIIDHDAKISLFESGAILIYLGEKSGKFYNENQRTIINQWLMGQMAYVGPMLGSTINFIITTQEKVNLVKKDTLGSQKEFIENLMKGYLNLDFLQEKIIL